MGWKVLGYEYFDEDGTERNKTVSGCKREYHGQYYVVSDWYKVHDV